MRSISSSFSSVQEFRDASMNRNADGTNRAQLRAACWTVNNAELERGLRVSVIVGAPSTSFAIAGAPGEQ